MQPFNHPIPDLIRQRYSCRSFLNKPINPAQVWQLESYIASACCQGPLGTHPRYGLIAATQEDSSALRGLSTYGFIKNPAGFIVGSTGAEEKNLEDFGYLSESIILYATDLGLGTCWLGGSFTRSTFVERFPLGPSESMPAVIAVGYPVEGSRQNDSIRRRAGAEERLPWETLFFEDKFGRSISTDSAGVFALPLEMVRLGPSASNKQPWRIIYEGGAWHFYLERTPGYGAPSPLFKMMRLADLQRVDIGIAMCHFDLTARQLGLLGNWVFHEPVIEKTGDQCEYVMTWRPFR
jgi:nitroreductase